MLSTYCRIAKRQSASLYLKQLVDIGVLAEVPSSKEKLFVHPKLMRLLSHEQNTFTLYEMMQ